MKDPYQKRHLPDSYSHSLFDYPAGAKTVDKKNSWNKESVASWPLAKNRLMCIFAIANPNFRMLQKTNPKH